MNSKYRNHATDLPTTAKVSCQVVTPDGTLQTKEEEIVCEKMLEVSVNGVPVFRLTCTPQHLTELVLGRLCTERIIRSADEVQQLFICGEGNIAEVTLSENVAFRPYSGAEPTCCTGNRQLAERVDPVRTEPGPVADVSPEAVFQLTEKFREDGALHRNTNGTHSCYLRFGDGRILSFEDIGRHNALDKAVGAMLLEGAEPADCMLYTTGRVAADMVTKLIGSGIPVMISKAVPTEEAVQLAKESNISLICKAWPDSYTRFN
jgi:FdhD protein